MKDGRRGFQVGEKASGGFSLVELCIVSGVMAFAGLLVAGFLNKPVAIQRFMDKADTESQLARQMDFIVNDLRQADPSSIDWNALPPVGVSISSISFQTTTYNNASPNTPSSTAVQYLYQPTSGASTGALVRVLGGASTTILNNVDAPSAISPLIQSDPSAYHVLMLTLWYHPLNFSPVRAIRRVAVKG